jgi:ABC-2 type transport system ATP-binding protein
LFTNGAYVIEAGITHSASGKSALAREKYSAEGLKELLQPIDGIMEVTANDDLFSIECSRDVTAEIARAIITSGEGLYYLNRKEYGLDDIYYRYFEGGAEHE